MAQTKTTTDTDLPLETPSETEGGDDDVISLWKGRITRAEAAQQKFFTKCADWYDLAHARVTDDDWAWHSRYFDPVLSAKMWSLAAKIVAGRSGWMTKPGKGTDPLNAKAAQYTLEYFERNPELDSSLQEKYVVAAIDAIVCGIGFIKAPWTIKKKTVSTRIINKGGVLTGKVKEKTFYQRFPDAINISVGDVLHSPAVSQSAIQKSPYVIFRSYTTNDDLKRTNEANGGSFYDNLDEVSGFGDFDPLTRARNRLLYTQVDSTIKMVEIHECWEKGFDEKTGAECVWITTLANRKVVLQDKIKSPLWHGKYPVAVFKIKPRGFAIEGEGIFETNERGQWTINDTTNHYMDAWNLANNPMMIQEESTVVDSYEVTPGAQFLYKAGLGGNKPEGFLFPQPNSQSYEALHQRILGSIETNSISGYQAGTPINASDNTKGTKGGIQEIIGAGDDQLAFYRQNFLGGVQELGEFWLQMTQQFQDDEIETEIPHPVSGQKIKVTITPDQIQGEMGIELQETALQSPNKQTDRANFDAFVNRLIELQPVAQNSPQPIIIDWSKVVKDMGEKYGANDADSYVKPGQSPQQQQAPAAPDPKMMQMMAEMQKSPTQKIAENASLSDIYKNSPPDVQAEILKLLGIQSSQMLPQDHVESLKGQFEPPTDLSMLPPSPEMQQPQPSAPQPASLPQ